MAIAIGGNSVNKAYLGTSEVQKMYLGADLVFDNSIQPSGITPIMTNFRVEDATPNQVHFDTPLGYPDGLTTTGFFISNKTINSVTKVDDNGGYFTVSSAFDFWDNTTIRLGEITDTTHSQSVLYDFSLEYVVNNITEPDAPTYRYVSLTGDNGNDGTSEGQAWRTLAYGWGQLSAGMTLWVKAGDYGNDKVITYTNGTPTAPIKIIGYKTAIGDGASLNWSYADTSPWNYSDPLAYVNGFDAAELPLISGTTEEDIASARGFEIAASNIIVKNIQMQFYGRGFFVQTTRENVWFDNCYVACTTYGFMADAELTKRFRCTNSVSFRGATNCIRSWGSDALVDNCQLWDDRDDEASTPTALKYSTDYYIGIEGDNSIFRNNHAERVGNTTHDGHGFSMKGSSYSNEHCLVEKSTVMGINLAIEFSRVNTKYCVAKDVQISRQSATTKADTGGITFLEKATWNLAERILVTDVNQGIFVTPPSDAKNNFVRNSIFDNCTMVIRGTGDSQTMEGCTIVNCGSMATEAATWTVIDTILSNTSRGSDSLFSYSYCDFHNSGTLPAGTGNILTDPQLDVNYLPGVQLDGTPVFGLEYDYDEVERNHTNPTMGAMEVNGVTPPVSEVDFKVSATDPDADFTSMADLYSNLGSIPVGSTIGFNRGETFRGDMGLKGGAIGNIMHYTAYGSGAKPKLLGSLNRSSTGDWVDEGSNIWVLDETLSSDTGNIIFNDEAFCGVKVLTAVEMTAQNDFFHNGVDDTLRLYSVSNPGTFYSNIELATTVNVLQIYNNSYVDISELDIRYSGRHGLNIDTASNINVYDLDLSYIGGSLISTGDVRLGNAIQLWDGNTDIVVERCVISQIYDAGLTPQGSGTYTQSNIIFRDNTVSNCEYSYEFFGDSTTIADNIHFINNDCSNAGGGWGHDQRIGAVRGTNVMLWEIPTATTNCTIKNNVFNESTEQSIMWYFESSVGDIDVDDNQYCESSGNVAQIGNTGTSYDYATEWEAYQLASGQDANSVKGGCVGTELITNGDFEDGDTGWSLENWTISVGKMNTAEIGNGNQSIPTIDNAKTYSISFISDGATGNCILYGDGFYGLEPYVNGVNEIVMILENSGGSQTNQLRFDADAVGTLDNVSCKEVV